MCDIRLFKSAFLDYQAALTLYQTPFSDEMFLNIVAYHMHYYIMFAKKLKQEENK